MTTPGEMPPDSGELCFPSSHGAELRGRWDQPLGPVAGYAIFAHCFTCSSESRAARRIAAELAARGIAVLRFDFTGLGESAGSFADSSFSGNIADLVSAAEWMTARGMPPSLLVGHSLGGAAVLAAAGRLPSVRAVATIGAPASPDHVAHLISARQEANDQQNHSDSNGDPDPDRYLNVDIGGRPFTIGREFLDDIAAQPQRERIAELRRDLLILHSPSDDVVGIENAREIFDAAKHPKSFVALPGADHLLARRCDAEFAAAIIAAWAHRLFPEPASTSRSTDTNMDTDPNVLTVSELSADRLTHEAAVRSHTWLLDEPAGVGEDLGPTPYDALLGALGACTSMTMRMYARRKGWEVGVSRVTLTHNRVHAKDCAECLSTTGMVDQIHRTITLDPALSPEQQDSLMLIADKCPVHRTLTSEVSITTSRAAASTLTARADTKGDVNVATDVDAGRLSSTDT
ncbi:MAG: alpha/beta fold hydrolase [Ornithinimicrobium sp.]